MSDAKKTGSISVDTSDILPIIKKWLYSEHDIFLRELISNSCDAITKREAYSRTNNLESSEGEIFVEVNKEAKTIKVKDNGIGMTEEEVEKYISQLAFSGAEEFVNEMKKQGVETKADIIGKFGLGFYSAFMVAKSVEVETLSASTGAIPVKWVSSGSEEYSLEDSTKNEVGTIITIHVDEDSENFLDKWNVNSTLKRYCDFMPYPILVGTSEEIVDHYKALENPTPEVTPEEELKTSTEDAENKEEAPEGPTLIEPLNQTMPLWRKQPSELKDEDYKEFYRNMFPTEQEPLFWIHLNVDHPFNLQGVLFFPKLNKTKPVNDRSIKLYAKQVYVSDNVKDVVPEFLALLKGCIDSTDIPLNVSRSALQGDPNIKKITNYIVKKVAESLKKLFKKDRSKFEAIWEDISLFVKYGIISDKKFDEMMRSMVIFNNSEEKKVTFEEYQALVPEDLKEKLKNKYIYFEQGKADNTLRKELLDAGVHVLETESYIDPHFMQHLEMNKKDEKDEMKFVSIGSEFENVLSETAAEADDLKVQDLFKAALTPEAVESTESKEDAQPAPNLNSLEVEVKNMKSTSFTAYFKVDEQMKRFAQMTQAMGNAGMSLPVKKTLVVNPSNPLIKNALKLSEQSENKELAFKICHAVQDLAAISGEGFSDDEKTSFVTRSQSLLEELTGKF
jgi:molecular chaperone HtpG